MGGMNRLFTGLCVVLLSSSIALAQFPPPCTDEPMGGYPFDQTCVNQCAEGPQGVVGPGMLADSSYDIAVFYLGHQA